MVQTSLAEPGAGGSTSGTGSMRSLLELLGIGITVLSKMDEN